MKYIQATIDLWLLMGFEFFLDRIGTSSMCFKFTGMLSVTFARFFFSFFYVKFLILLAELLKFELIKIFTGGRSPCVLRNYEFLFKDASENTLFILFLYIIFAGG